MIKIISLFVYLILLQQQVLCFAESKIDSALTIKREVVFKASEDSVCSVSINYPVVTGLNDKKVEAKINSFLKTDFLDIPEWLNIEDCDHENGFTFESDYDVRYNSTQFLSIQQSVYEYTGGAHGNYALYAYNINIENGELITLSGIIKPEQFNLFSEIVITNLLEDKDASTLTEAGLFEDTLTISPEQDFYIIPGFLVLQFDPYEIASYATGQIEIEIPFNSIKELLKPDLPFKTNE